MAFNLDNAFGIHADALKLRAQRTAQLAANIANVDTPNYKAKDIDFQAAMKQVQQTNGASTLTRTQAGHLSASSDTTPTAPLLYRIPLQPSLDGNTVNAQIEQAAFAKNTVEYQASFSFLNGRIKGLMTALKGE
ncbi:MAG: flagellar basal body rod protein FlgB [Thiotrichaceae bacterium]|nr:flagellar basal body rod protein FlgB [Thiotrichaceae bacterium]PCI15089.1 MAG: flagellar basal body rod protein FlgB [Thiotrichales bacterium]